MRLLLRGNRVRTILQRSTKPLPPPPSLSSSSSSPSSKLFFSKNNCYNEIARKQLKPTTVRSLSTAAHVEVANDTTEAAAKTFKLNVSDDDLAVIQATFEIIQPTLPLVDAGRPTGFTEHFCKRMLEDRPDLLGVFYQTNQVINGGKQHPRRLFSLMETAATSAIETGGEAPMDALESVCHKHCALGIQPEAYEAIGKHVLGTLSDIFTKEESILRAWKRLYEDVATAMINREKELYDEMAKHTPGGWLGRRKFVLEKKEAMGGSTNVTRFRFVPADGGSVPAWKPGLYTTVWCPIEEEKVKDKVLSSPFSSPPRNSDNRPPRALYAEQARHYTLAAPAAGDDDGSLSISVKKDGLVSTILHEAIEGSEWDLSAPYGCFNASGTEALWTEDTGAPVVFLSAGVDITPVLAMLENIYTTRPVSWLHGSTNGSNTNAYHDRLRHAPFVRRGELQRRVWYSNPIPELDGKPAGNNDNLARFHFQGDLNAKEYAEMHGRPRNPKTQYFVCGPPSFMEHTKRDLIDLGVSSDRIHVQGS